MNLNFFQWQSLKTRVTLFTLGIFLISIWSLAFYVSRMLREDMQRLLGDQQFSTASFIAAEVNQELEDRFNSLAKVAGRVTTDMLGNPAALQAFLKDRLIIQEPFNGGVIAYGLDGTAIAEVPLSAGPIGAISIDINSVAATLKEGKSTITRPIMGGALKAPVFAMAVPIRDPQNKVIGTLTGVVNLGKPNFLDKITEGHYGKTGSYVLVAAQYRLIVTASDKSRIMEVLPAPGVNSVIDHNIQGYEGSDVVVNPLGAEVLRSIKRVPAAGWYVGVTLPTAEAFAPIRAMQQRILLAAIFLTLLAGGLTWWMLRRQLSPMFAAVKTLATLSDTDSPLKPLPIARQDEIGELIGGFNRLLETVGQREIALRKSEQSLRITERQMSISQQISRTGSWVYYIETNEIWGSAEGLRIFGFPPVAGNFPLDEIEACIPDRDRVHQALVALISEGRDYDLEYTINPTDESPQKIIHSVARLEKNAKGNPLAVLGFIQDITEHKHAEAELERHREHLDEMVVERTAQLRNLTTELTFAEERERRAIAQDLHDDLGQSLAVIKLRLTLLKPPGGKEWDDDLMQQVQQISDMVDQANRSVRSLSMQLNPPMLSGSGLAPALEWLAEEMQRNYGLKTHIHCDGEPPVLDATLGSSVFRTVRELLINVSKHAKVDTAEVSVLTDAEKLVITVADAGIGFDVKKGLPPSADGGYGLFSVRERLHYIGGDIQIDSRPGDGTLVVLTLPLDAIEGRPRD